MNIKDFILGYVIGKNDGGGGASVEPLTVTENGEYSEEGVAYSPVTVNVAGGGGGLEYEEGTWTPSEDTQKGTITFTNQHTKAPAFYVVADIGAASGLTGTSILTMAYYDCYQLFKSGVTVGTGGSVRYSFISIFKTSANGTSFGDSAYTTSANSDSAYASTSNYPKWWCTNTELHVCDGDQTNYCRANRTYKWFAVWLPEA